MTLTQQIITIALCVLGTQLTRFVPFLIFNEHRKTPAFVQYLGKVLPGAIFSMLVVYCLRSVSFRRYSYGLPELIGIFITAGLHLWKRNILLSIAAGTCNVTRSVSKMTEIERRGGKRWDKPKKAEKSRDCGGGKF